MLRLPAEWLYKRNFYAFYDLQQSAGLREVRCTPIPEDACRGELIKYSYKKPLYKRVRSLVGDARRYFVHKNAFTQRVVRSIKPRHIPPAESTFTYSLFRNDGDLLAEITECLHSHQSLHEVLDIKKCLRFIDDFKACNYQGQSQDQQAETMGTLATMCLSIKYLNQ